MPTPIKLNPHLSEQQLYQRYRKCQKPREKIRWHALYLISKGGIANRVANRLGRSSGWITNLARRYNQLGPDAVADRRSDVACGVKPTLNAQKVKALDNALRGPAPDGGLWTAPKVANWIAEQTGKQVHTSTAWRAMRSAGFTLQVPRPRHGKTATADEQAAFKKSSPRQSIK